MMRILLLTMMMMIATPAPAGLYKWTDNDGNVHYSQKRPRNQEFERLKAPPTPDNDRPLYQSSSPSQSKKGPSSTPQKETEKNLRLRAINCAKSKQNLQVYQVYRRVRDKEGNVKILSDTERAQNIENAKKSIEEYCN